jgi:lipid-A-disaccharide synthase
MKYYLIAGEASGDLHASRLMRSLKGIDKEAAFRFFGGDLMTAEGGTRVRHYKELAYMGFIPVLLHLPTILRNMRMCKQDIAEWRPDVVILVDYPGFNLDIAKYVKAEAICPVYYYISPKIWAWKEYRIKNIKRDVDELFSILPFEVDFFEKKHHYPIHYVGNPTMNEVREYLSAYPPSDDCGGNTIALLAGSRKQEIKDNLPAMVEVAKAFPQYQFVVAGAPGIDEAYYAQFLEGTDVRIVHGQTYALLAKAHAALVTSGTATLETALFNVPQVVCYKLPLPRLASLIRKWLLKVKYISLVNLIADREVVTELVGDTFTVVNIQRELMKILDGTDRLHMLDGYADVQRILSEGNAPDNAAGIMYKLLNNLSI